MEAMHVTAETWGKILRGERFAGEGELASHLRQGCTACDETIAAFPPDGLDGEADRRLIAVSAPTAAKDDLAFERVMRQLKLDSRVKGTEAPPSAIKHPKALPLALAGCLAFAGMSVLMLQRVPYARGPYQGEKGEAGPAEVSLSFAVGVPGHGETEVEKGVPEASYPEDKAVMLRYDLTSPAFVTLVRVPPDGKAEVLAQPGRLGPGSHDLLVNDMPAGVSLKGAVGRNRFAVLTSPHPLVKGELATALDAVTSETHGALSANGIGVAEFDIDVVEAP